MKRSRLPTWCWLFLGLLLTCRASAGQPSTTAAARATNSDLLVLTNGERFTGSFVPAALHLQTPYGSLTLAKHQLGAVQPAEGAPGAIAVTTTNGDRLTGIPGERGFRFDPAGSSPRQVPWSTVAHLVCAGAATSGALGGVAPAVPAVGSTNLDFVWIPPGEFLMGSPAQEAGRDPDEGPQTRVVLPQGFWMGRCEVTQAQFQRVMGVNPSNTTDDPKRPVDRVTWFEAQEYCQHLTQKAREEHRLPAGYAYRLPTEAEWEYACRAGSTTRYCYGDDPSDAHLGEYAWFMRNSDSTTHPVGLKQPNAWGLNDMHGNVWEWCLDRWDGALPGGSITNRPAAATGHLRTARGGSWLYDGKSCRAANRDDYSPWNRCSDIGFRIVLAPEPAETIPAEH